MIVLRCVFVALLLAVANTSWAQLTIQIDAETFSVGADGVATVSGTVSDPAGTHAATFWLVSRDGRWLLVDARPSRG